MLLLLLANFSLELCAKSIQWLLLSFTPSTRGDNLSERDANACNAEHDIIKSISLVLKPCMLDLIDKCNILCLIFPFINDH